MRKVASQKRKRGEEANQLTPDVQAQHRDRNNKKNQDTSPGKISNFIVISTNENDLGELPEEE